MPVRARIIGHAADDQVNLLLKRLAQVPGYIPEMLREAVPTVTVLLSHATTSSAVERKANPYTPRAYNVDAETQQRIDANTVVDVQGNAIHVGLSTGSDHERPVVPIGELPLKWRGAISQKINGCIRRKLAVQTATGFVERSLAGGPMTVRDFNAAARAEGIKGRALREAKAALGVRKEGGRNTKAVFTRAPKPPPGAKVPRQRPIKETKREAEATRKREKYD